MLGIFHAGGVLAPINTRFKGGDAADVLSRTWARALCTVTDFLGTDYVAMLEATVAELPALETIVVLQGSVGSTPFRPDNVTGFCANDDEKTGGRPVRGEHSHSHKNDADNDSRRASYGVCHESSRCHRRSPRG